MIPVSTDDLVIIHQGDENIGPPGKWCRKTRHSRRALNSVNRLILYAANAELFVSLVLLWQFRIDGAADNGVRHFMN